ncbi:hypothetical protein BCR34DRAFT_638793 [Clohesyomyces aquaticus]|uniref:Uncharacterized protein n=1 Tax=Clohesyomyces aquaticus TaxID=1231657 RepID=A0A1Y2A188_9PLEO|nr:hypothetical protein BCR34DRAFT_638793 [Clohesyomyces aquaticus]
MRCCWRLCRTPRDSAFEDRHVEDSHASRMRETFTLNGPSGRGTQKCPPGRESRRATFWQRFGEPRDWGLPTARVLAGWLTTPDAGRHWLSVAINHAHFAPRSRTAKWSVCIFQRVFAFAITLPHAPPARRSCATVTKLAASSPSNKPPSSPPAPDILHSSSAGPGMSR